MKIVFLSFYSGNVSRGVETFVHELANRLSNTHEVIVFQGGPKLPGSNYSTQIIPEMNIRKFTIQSLKRINGNNLILFPTNGRSQSLLCKIWSIKNKSKLIISGQSGPGLDDRINLWTMPNVFVALTDFQHRWASSTNPFVKIKTIPNGVDLKRFRPGKSLLKTSLPKPIILYVAALHKEKRQSLAIRAVSKLRHGSLLLVGDGPDKESLSILGNDLLSGRFQIMSFKHEQMPQVYRLADLFTYPTVSYESFGIAIVEALASGLAVVANNDPIRKEIIGDAGLFVDCEDTTSYSEGLGDAISTNWNKKPVDQAAKFSWDLIAKKYSDILSILLP